VAAVIAKEAFRSGFNVESLLAGRFALAAIAFWLIVTVRSKIYEPARRPPRPSYRTLVMAVGLGAVGYAFQSAFYFGALTRLNASVVAQLLYIYPALVLVIAVLRGRESLEARKIIALLCSALGLVLLLHGGAGGGSMSLAGVLMALGAAGTYALYITVAGGLPDDLDLYLLAAIVCSAATISVAGYAAVAGTLHGPRYASDGADGGGDRYLPGGPEVGRRFGRGNPVLHRAGGDRRIGRPGVLRAVDAGPDPWRGCGVVRRGRAPSAP
jgi:drug/metabolite transporter (DMT)-like permease